MNELHQQHTERSRILLVYAYHPDETFHQEVALELEKENLPSVRVVKYQGKHIPRERDYTIRPLRGFLRKHLPFDYAIELHDSPDAVDNPERKLIWPCFMYLYESKISASEGLKSDLEKYQQELEKKHNRWVEVHYFPPVSDASSTYSIVNVELFPRYVTKNDSIEFLKGLINILYRHRHHRV